MKNSFWEKMKKPIIGLAPMAGVTDEPMRVIQTEICKPDVIYTEFISVDGYLKKKEYFDKHLIYKDAERPVIVQVFGANPETFKRAIPKIIKKGFDGLDINMGCPARSVIEKGGGGALIGNYDLAGKIIKIVLDVIKESGCKIPLSVKTRIGKDPQTTKKWSEFLSCFPLSQICMHARLLSHGLSGDVNWKELSVASEIIRGNGIVFLGNGGIKSIAEAEEKCKEFDLDGVLIGRAALGNPWVFMDSYIPKKKEILETILKHAKLVWDLYGKEDFIRARKHFGWYPRGFKGSKRLRIKLLRTNTLDEVINIVDRFRD
jgi:tRNA-dihydrouridine synthase B